MDEERRTVAPETGFDAEIARLIADHLESPTLAAMLSDYHPFDVARALPALDEAVRKRFFAVVPIDLAAGVFEHLERTEAVACLQELPAPLAVAILDRMETDDAVDLLQELKEAQGDVDLVDRLSPMRQSELRRFSSYADTEIGSAMSNSYIELGASMKVTEAMKKVTAVAAETESIAILYVVDRQKLVGQLQLKRLIIARAAQTIAEIMEPHPVTADPRAAKETVARTMLDYGSSSLPIVDADQRILGIVTYDDLMDVIDAIRNEDYARLAAVGPAEIAAPELSVRLSVRSRLPWLVILLGLSALNALILTAFDRPLSASAGAVALAASLAIYLPLLLDMSGNAGTQSLAVMIRYLAVHDNVLTKAQIRARLGREIGAGILQGLLVGLVVFAFALVAAFVRSDWPPAPTTLAMGAVTAVAIAVALASATVLGAFVPLVMSWLHKDPAVASGPFITTLADILTLAIYYGMSLALLLPLYAV